MSLIEILLIIAAIVGISAGIPQFIQLVKTKNSDEFSLKTWSIWVGTQSVSAVYAMTIGDPFLSVINSLWVVFYITMSVLIVQYSPKARARRANKAAAKVLKTAPVAPSTTAPTTVVQ